MSATALWPIINQGAYPGVGDWDVIPAGPVEIVPRQRPWKSLLQRWWSKVDVPFRPFACWTWRGGRNGDGYGKFGVTVGPRQVRHRGAHAVGYELLVGAIPVGLEIDHLCRNRACVRPDHLDVVPHSVNTLRSDNAAAVAARATHCRCGRPYEVLLKPQGRTKRVCRPCDRVRSVAANRSYRERQRAMA